MVGKVDPFSIAEGSHEGDDESNDHRCKSSLMKNNLLGRVDAVQASDCAHIQRWKMYLIFSRFVTILAEK